MFITGSTSGFGRALVDEVRARGERVVATARRPQALADLAGDDVLTLELDVTREAAIQPALDAAVGHFGRVGLLVDNAGVGFVGAPEETALAELRSVMETMFFAPAALTRAVIPQRARPGRDRADRLDRRAGDRARILGLPCREIRPVRALRSRRGRGRSRPWSPRSERSGTRPRS